MGVYFGCQDAFVSEHLLHLADRGAAFEQMGGERVAEGVRADTFVDSGASCGLLEYREDHHRVSFPPRLFRKSTSSPERTSVRLSR